MCSTLASGVVSDALMAGRTSARPVTAAGEKAAKKRAVVGVARKFAVLLHHRSVAAS